MKPNIVVLAAATMVLTSSAATSLAQTPPPPPPPAQSAKPAFPPPKVVAVTEALKCDWGPITSVASGKLIVSTPAGPFTVNWGDARLIGADANARVSPAELKPDQNVRVYYLVKDGAQALEIDLIPAPQK
jgi:hypothetical protein